MTVQRLWAVVLLTRPQFLAGAALVYGMGAAAAAASGNSVDWGRYAVGQLMVTSIQLLTHYANEHFDQASDRASTNRTWLTGGSGVLADGRLPETFAIRAAAVSAILSIVFIMWTYSLSPVAGLLGAVAMAAGWFYSAPPLQLEGSGFGELVATAVVTLLVPVTAVMVQGAEMPPSLWWAIAGMAGLQLAMLLAFSIPDLETDRAQGKVVLAARLGLPGARMMHAASVTIGLAVLVVASSADQIPLENPWVLMPAVGGAIVQIATLTANSHTVLTTAAAGTFLWAAGSVVAGYVVGGGVPV